MADRDVLRRIGDRVRAAREKKGWSQSKLATHAKLNKETVNRMELGGNVWLETAYKVARALGVRSSEILHDPDDLIGHGTMTSSVVSEASSHGNPLGSDSADLLEFETRHDSVLNTIEEFATQLQELVSNERKATETRRKESARRRPRRTAHR